MTKGFSGLCRRPYLIRPHIAGSVGREQLMVVGKENEKHAMR
jgi:hypothetical protein